MNIVITLLKRKNRKYREAKQWMWDSKDYDLEPLLYTCFIKCFSPLLNRCYEFICVKPQKREHMLFVTYSWPGHRWGKMWCCWRRWGGQQQPSWCLCWWVWGLAWWNGGTAPSVCPLGPPSHMAPDAETQSYNCKEKYSRQLHWQVTAGIGWKTRAQWLKWSTNMTFTLLLKWVRTIDKTLQREDLEQK